MSLRCYVHGVRSASLLLSAEVFHIFPGTDLHCRIHTAFYNARRVPRTIWRAGLAQGSGCKLILRCSQAQAYYYFLSAAALFWKSLVCQDMYVFMQVARQEAEEEEVGEEEAEEVEEEGQAAELYCLCRQPDDPAAPRDFVACDKCEQWFHPECVDTTMEVRACNPLPAP